MTATLLYRVAAIVFVLFAVGHTYGFLSLRAPSAEGRAVYDSMNAVRFELRGRSYSLRRFLPRLRLVLHGIDDLVGVSVVVSWSVGSFTSHHIWLRWLCVATLAVT